MTTNLNDTQDQLNSLVTDNNNLINNTPSSTKFTPLALAPKGNSYGGLLSNNVLNTPAIFGVPTLMAVLEDNRVVSNNLVARGSISITDPDKGQSNFLTTVLSESGNLGNLSISADGTYVYTVDNTLASVQQLGAGDTHVDAFQISSADGTSQIIQFTIFGANDIALIGVPTISLVTENPNLLSSQLIATGSISISDIDQGQSSLRTSVISAVSNFGKLTLSSDGNYIYSVDNSLSGVQQLRAGETHIDRFLITSFDGTSKIIDFTIYGSNESAIIGSPSLIDVTEDKNIISNQLTASGTISISDTDLGEASYLTTVASNSENWGSLVLTKNGAYSYSVNNTFPSLQQLGANDSHTDHFTITSIDGTSKTIDFIVHGTNDIAVIGLPTVSGVTEDSSTDNSRLIANGSISISDTDVGQAIFQTKVVSGIGNLGTLVLSNNGAYSYSVDNTLSSVQALGYGDTHVDHFTITSLDGTSKSIVFTIYGSNDAAVISAPTVATVTEDLSVFNNKLNAYGAISIEDADQGQAVFQTTVVSNSDNLGFLTLSSNGAYSYTVDNTQSGVQQLGASDSHVDHFTITSIDGTTKIISFTILGVNDAAVIGTPSVSFVKEDINALDSQLIAQGSISISDADLGTANLITEVVPAVANLGVLTLASNGSYFYTVNNNLPDVQQMRDGDSHIDHFVIKSNDGTTKVIDFTIFGTNDAAVIGAPSFTSITEDTNVVNGQLFASGSISISDIDQNQSSFLTTVISASDNLGVLTLSSNGNYTYSVNNTLADVQHLESGDTHVDHFTISALDGTTKNLDFTINGVNDLYLIGTPSISSVYEDQNVVSDYLVINGSISVRDPNLNPASLLTTVISGPDNLGTLIISADGAYTYSVDNNLVRVQQLGQNDKHIDYFTITAADNTTKIIDFTIHGTNDSAVITGSSTANLTQSSSTLTATGFLNATDIDNANAFQSQTNVSGSNGYGNFTIYTDGGWTYTTNSAHIEFVDGVIYHDSITVMTADGTSQIITVDIAGTNDSAIISGVNTLNLIESSAVLSANGTLIAVDTDSSNAFVVQTGVEGNNGYGKFSINAAGAWNYTADSEHTEFVDGVVYHDSITVATTDGTSQLITVSITGTNNAAVIIGSHSALLTESNNVLTASGNLSASDIDSSNAFVVQTGVEGNSGYGKFSINAAGAWTYTADSAHSEFVDGVVYHDSITVATADGTNQLITVSITGVNNAAVITGSHSALLTESNNVLTASGNLSASDIDSSNAFVVQTGVEGNNGYGKFSINTTGAWTYTADSAHSEFVDGVFYQDSITVATADGTSQLIIVNITGTNNAAVITGTHSALLTESNDVLTASGNLSASDVDSSNAFVAQTGVEGNNGYGKFSINAAGAWTYSADSAHSEFVDGVVYQDSITVATADGTSQLITISITGVNNAAVITGLHTAVLVESDTVLTASGVLNATDVDSSNAFVVQTGVEGDNGYGKFSINAAGAWTFTTDSAHSEFVDGVAFHDSITIATADGTSQLITVSITGTNNAAVITGTHTAELVESETVLTTSGNLSASDVDSSNAFVVQTDVKGNNGYGKFNINAAGAWTFTADSAHSEFVDGVFYHDSITVATADGTSQLITVSITGTNNAAVITGSYSALLTESNDVLNASGDLSASDVDSSNAFVAQTNVEGNNGYGKFSINAAGVWTYTADSTHSEFIDGVVYHDSITVATADGTSQLITVSITGVNNAAVITGSHSALLTESNDILTASGNLSASDVDSSNAFVPQTDIEGNNGYGKFSINSEGAWTYTADSAHSEFVDGVVYHDSITVATADGTSQLITVNIAGVNNAAVITGTHTAELVESDSVLTASGVLSATDVDSSHTFVAQTAAEGKNGYGKFSINSTGAWTYTADNAHSEFVDGVVYHDSITVATADGTSQLITVSITGVNNAALITGTHTAELVESDTLLNASGNLSASDVDSSHAFVAQTSVEGTNGYGKFSINAAGAWTYTADSAHSEFVDGVIYQDSITVNTADGTTQLITVSITGTNNAAVISGTYTAELLESDTVLTTSGNLSASDVDSSNAFVVQTDVKGNNGYGKFSINAEGAWTYTADSAHSEFVDGVIYQDSITVATADGTSQLITVSITGTNNAAVITGTHTADLVESETFLTTSGNLSASDVDSSNAFVTQTSVEGNNGYGKFSINAAGAWTYTADSAHSEFVDGVVYQDSITVATADGTSQRITVSITGVNNAAVITGSHSALLTESNDTLTASGNLSASDADSSNAFFAQTDVDGNNGYGKFSINVAGAWTYFANSAHSEFVDGVVYQDSITVATADGTSQLITVNITGTNNAAVITGTHSALLTESNDVLTASGNLSASDVDSSNAFVAQTAVEGNNGYGKFSINAAGAWTYIADSAHSEFLDGVVYLDSITVATTDGTSQLITVNITGVNNAAVITGIHSAELVESDNVLTASGVLNATDVDSSNTFVVQTGVEGNSGYGKFSINTAGAWTYTADSAHSEFVDGVVYHDSITVATADGTSQLITVSIAGTNNAAVITGGHSASLTESNDVLTASGNLSVSDVDSSNAFVAQTNVEGNNGYGKFTINAAGVWTYTADSTHSEFVDGLVYHDSITVTTADGTSQLITVSITGTNNAAVITGTHTAELVESDSVLTASGVLNATDVDSSNAFVVQTSVEGNNGYGKFSINAAGTWTYTADSAHSEFVDGVVYHDSITVNTADGTTQLITVSIAGVNNAAVITGTHTAELVESDTVLTANGVLNATDVDSSNAFVVQTGVEGDNGYGKFTINAAGVWTYTADSTHSEFVDGLVYHDSITVTTADGTSQLITVSITGTNNAAVITGTHTAELVESDSVLNASGILTATDVDSSNAFVAQTGIKGNNGNGKFSINAAGAWTYTADSAHNEFVEGITYTDQLSISTTDGTTKDIIVNIIGTNDAAIISGINFADLIETNSILSTTENLIATDVDSSNTFVEQSNIEGSNGFGSFSIDASGVWSYIINTPHDEFVAGSIYHDSFTAITADGTRRTITVNLQGTNDAAIIGKPSNSVVTEDNLLISDSIVQDQNLRATGSISIHDADLGQSILRSSVISDPNNLGVLTIQEDGTYIYTVDNSLQSVQELGANDSHIDHFNVTAIDGTTTAVDFTINGTNDIAEIGLPTENSVTEEDGVVSNMLTASGIISITDIDKNQANFLISVKPDTNNLGTLVLASDGTYTYSVDNTQKEVQALGNSDTHVDHFTVTSVDGTTKVLEFTIYGTNDAAIIGLPISASVTEDENTVSGSLTATGNISISDVDQGQSSFLINVIAADTNLGKLTLDVQGNYLYTVDNSLEEVQKLGIGETYIDYFTVQAFDGTFKDIEFTIDGSNDRAVIGTPSASLVIEDNTGSTNSLTVTGSIPITDTDHGQAYFLTRIESNKDNLGTLVLDSFGSYVYTVDNTLKGVQQLGVNDVHIDHFTVTSVDGTTKAIEFSIHGTEDAATIGEPSVNVVTEDYADLSNNLIAHGFIAINDIDQGQSSLLTRVSSAQSNLGTLQLETNGAYTYSVDNSLVGVQQLGAGDTHTDYFTISALDGTAKVIEFLIQGTQDAAVISNPSVAAVTEDSGVDSGYLIARGTISITDTDLNQSRLLTSVISDHDNIGQLVIDSQGNYVYTVDNSLASVQQLGASDTHTDYFTLTALDGTAKIVDFTIHGTQDIAVIGNPSVNSVTEDVAVTGGQLIASGIISITDADQGQASLLATVQSAEGNLGSLQLETDGHYVYQVNNKLTAVQQLDAGQTHEDYFTISAIDGTTKIIGFTIHGTYDSAAPIAISGITPDSGTVGDFLTNTRYLTVSGTNGLLRPDQKIQISTDNVNWFEVNAADQTWSYSDSTRQIDGIVNYKVRVIDLAGNVGNTANQDVTINTIAPTIHFSTPISSDGYLNHTESNTTLNIMGVTDGADGQIATIHLGSKDFTSTVLNGSFSVAVSSADLKDLNEGTVNITANVSDAAGNAATTATASYVYDKTAPTIAITTPISTDGYLNNVESDGSLHIAGTATGADGQIATIHIGTKDYTATVLNGAFNVTVPSTDLKALTEGTVNITANISDAAGNAATTATASYVYDTSAPTITITTPISTDGYLNNVESDGSLNIEGTASGADGQIATVHIGSKDYTATVLNGAFKVAVSSADLKALTEGTVNITADISDAAGNAAITANASYVYDKTAPTIAITTSISGDGYLNSAESNSTLNITGAATGADGQIATVHIGAKDYTTIVSNGAFSVAVSSTDLSALTEGTVNITANVSDAAGNAATTATASYVYDMSAPTIAITTSISGDGYLNNTESNSTLNIAGTATGANGQIATVHIGTKDYTATILNGAYSVAVASADLKALSEGVVNITANVSDIADNAATAATASYIYDKTAPTIAITTPISEDGYLNSAESNSTLNIAGTVTGADEQIATVHIGAKDYTSTVSNGTFSVAVSSTDLKALSEGTVNITANVSDLAGNAATAATASYFYDKTAPMIAITTPISGDGYLNSAESNSTLNIVGTATGADGQIATVHIGTKDYTSTVSNGAFSVVVASADLKALSEGVVNITANVSDAAGNQATQATASYVYDKTAPTIAITTPISGDGYLNSAESNSTLNIAGTATGADGQIATVHIGTKDYTSTVSNGAFSVAVSSTDLKALSEGTVNINANVSDIAGNAATAATASYIYDRTAPTISITAPISGDGYLNSAESNSTLNITGTATGADGQIATVHVGTKDYTSTVSNGAFNVIVASADLKALSEEVVNITANVSDIAGNAATAATASYIYDKTAPTIAITTPISGDGYLNNAESNSTLNIAGTATGADGQIATVHIGTKDYTSTVSNGAFSVAISSDDLKALTEGTINITANVSDIGGNAATAGTASYIYDKTAPTISITAPISGDSYLNSAESNSTLNIAGTATGVDGQIATVHIGTKDYTSTVSNGAFSVAVISADLKALGEGIVNITANVTDIAGNTATAATASYIYDKTAPTIAITTPISGDGYLNSAESNSTLNITGTAAGADGQIATVHIGTKDYTSTVSNGAFSVAVVSADLQALNEGTVNITANVSDVAGNTATTSTASYIFDKTSPTAIATITALSSDTGIVGDFVTSTATQTISGTYTGTLGSGETIQVSADALNWSDVTASSGIWSTVSNSIILAGTGNYSVRTIDTAGNVTAGTGHSYVLDTQAPAAAVAITAISTDSGIAGDFITNDTTLTVSGTNGTLGTSEKIQVATDGLTWHDATVTSNTWSYIDPTIQTNGVINYQVRVMDLAGNIGNTANHNVTIDTLAPTLAITTPISTDGYLNITESNSVMSIAGTATGADGQTVSMHIGTKDYTSVISGGTYTVNVASVDLKALTEGTVAITANVSDIAGNAASQATTSFVYDKTAPTISITTPISTDGYLNNAESNSSLNISGTASGAENQTVTLHLGTKDYSSTVTTGSYTVTVSSADLRLLSEGTNTITANVSDTAGNAATQASASYIYDKTPPTAVATITALSSDTGIAGDFVTTAAAQTVSGTYTGTLGSGEKIQISANSISWTDATASAGLWSTAANAVTLSGTGTYNVRTIDTAGNTTIGVGHSYTLDTLAPHLNGVTASQTTLDRASGVTATLTFTFGEALYGLDLSDFAALSYGTLTNLTQTSGTPSQWTALYTDTKTQNSVTIETINIKSTGSTLGHDLAGNLLATSGNTGTTLTVGKAPVVLDLNGDGVIQYLDQSAGITYDFAHDGQPVATSWVGPQDGLLAIKQTDQSLNITFSTQVGETDLQGLAKVYDTNHDNILSTLDSQFQNFGVWQDTSSNGKVDSGEFLSLTQAGITSISLVSNGIASTAASGEVLINGQTTFTKTDGTTGIADDAAFITAPIATPITSCNGSSHASSDTSASATLPKDTSITLTDVLQIPAASAVVEKSSNNLGDIKHDVPSASLPEINPVNNPSVSDAAPITLVDLFHRASVDNIVAVNDSSQVNSKIDLITPAYVPTMAVVHEELVHV